MTFLSLQDIFLPFSLVLSGLLILALLAKRNHDLSQWILLALLVLTEVRLYVIQMVTKASYQASPNFTHNVLIVINLILIPIPYIYISSYVDQKKLFWNRALRHFAIFLTTTTVYFILQTFDFFGMANTLPTEIYFGFLYSGLIAVPYLVASFRELKKFDCLLKNNCSDLSKVHISWLRLVIYAFYLCVILEFASAITGPTFPLWQFSPVVGTFVKFMFVFFSLNHSKIFDDVSQGRAPEKPPAPPHESRLSQLEIERYKKKLFEVLDEKKAFLNMQFSLKDLSDQIGLKPYKTSELINSSLGTTFYSLINSRRVEWAKKLLVEPASSHLNILGIATNSGFNSKSVFNDVFKKMTSMTPKEFRATEMSQKTN